MNIAINLCYMAKLTFQMYAHADYVVCSLFIISMLSGNAATIWKLANFNGTLEYSNRAAHSDSAAPQKRVWPSTLKHDPTAGLASYCWKHIQHILWEMVWTISSIVSGTVSGPSRLRRFLMALF